MIPRMACFLCALVGAALTLAIVIVALFLHGAIERRRNRKMGYTDPLDRDDRDPR